VSVSRLAAIDVGTGGSPRALPSVHTGAVVGTRDSLIDIVVPVYNEARELAPSVRRLSHYLSDRFPFAWRITIADNASTDGTWAVAQQLAADIDGVRALHLDQKGRGRALRTAWMASEASILAYMDVDLSTDLDALLPLVAPLLSGHSQIAIGSRLAVGARVVRGVKREVISRCYNALLRLALRARFKDAQCGFKAIRADVARRLLPEIKDEAWFFDTELLILAQRSGLRIHEVPVDWVDDPDSRVDIVSTAVSDLRGILRVSRSLRQFGSFGMIGVMSTLAYVLLFNLLRNLTSAPIANALALLATAIANTAANRRLTFGVVGRGRLTGDHAGGLAALGVALTITTTSLLLLHLAVPNAGRLMETMVLIAASAIATLARFLLLRAWIFQRRRGRRNSLVARSYPSAPPSVAARTVGGV
jgi:glycosyltransferase involved in cell wall biosynthesis